MSRSTAAVTPSIAAPWQPGEDTIGYAYDEQRRRLDDERLVSGRVESAVRGLAGRYRLVRTFTDHIEGHVAARMREPDGPTHVVLVENNEPCQYAAGCHRLLRDILPIGKTITIYVKGQRGVRLTACTRATGRESHRELHRRMGQGRVPA